MPDCVLCRGPEGDQELDRVGVWEDELWRLTASLSAEVPGFCYLEPKRHVRDVTALAGDEARTFGSVLARVCTVLRDVTGAELVYVYVFGGGVPHLHVHLAPHRAGDALNDQMVKGDVVEERLPSGASRIVSEQFPPLAPELLRGVAERIREALAPGGATA